MRALQYSTVTPYRDTDADTAADTDTCAMKFAIQRGVRYAFITQDTSRGEELYYIPIPVGNLGV